MAEEDFTVESELTEINAQKVVVNTGWTTEMAKWNTIGTVAGAIVGLMGLIISLVTLCLVLCK